MSINKIRCFSFLLLLGVALYVYIGIFLLRLSNSKPHKHEVKLHRNKPTLPPTGPKTQRPNNETSKTEIDDNNGNNNELDNIVATSAATTTKWQDVRPETLKASPALNAASATTNPHIALIERRFSNNVQLNIDRGLNIINDWSAQHMTAWIYAGREKLKKTSYHTWKIEPKAKFLYDPNDASKLSSDDTLYVNHIKLKEFTREFLPHINTTFVLITTYYKFFPWGLKHTAPILVNNNHLLRWFATNIGKYTGGYKSHPKVSPFALGLKANMGTDRDFQNPAPYYRQVFLNTINYTEADKTNTVFVGQLSKTTEGRAGIPSGPRLPYKNYLEEISRSSYVLSPDGIHPDCNRHYESLGLGAIPITQLDSYLYSHLKEGRVIYNNSNWNVAALEATLPFPAPKVNRNMVFEEYWMEHIEGIVGRRLWWWDGVENKRLKLVDFFPKANMT